MLCLKGTQKQSKRSLNLIMLDTVSPGQFRAIYQELTGDNTSDNKISKQYHDRMRLILKVGDDNIFRDLRVHNTNKSSFDDFLSAAETTIEDLKAVTDRRHAESAGQRDVVVNMALGMSICDLYERRIVTAKAKKIKDEYTQRAPHVESTSIQRVYYVDASRAKFRQISTSFPHTSSM